MICYPCACTLYIYACVCVNWNSKFKFIKCRGDSHRNKFSFQEKNIQQTIPWPVWVWCVGNWDICDVLIRKRIVNWQRNIAQWTNKRTRNKNILKAIKKFMKQTVKREVHCSKTFCSFDYVFYFIYSVASFQFICV